MKNNFDEKSVRKIERIFKGVSNHNRIKILNFIAQENETTLWQISQWLGIELKNASQHTARMEKAGLISKEYVGHEVMHFLTPYGEEVFEFIKALVKK